MREINAVISILVGLILIFLSIAMVINNVVSTYVFWSSLCAGTILITGTISAITSSNKHM